MKDSNSSVEVLTQSFTTMAYYVEMISDTVHTLPDDGETGVAKKHLGELGERVSDTGRLFNPAEWVALQQKIRSGYSTAAEVAMFNAVMQGTPVHEAVDRFMAEMKDRADDIELF